MSYIEAHADPAARAKAAVLVGGIHALLGFGLIAGLAISYTVTKDEVLSGTSIEDEPVIFTPPPPPPDPVPTETLTPPQYVPPQAPLPRVDLPREDTIKAVPNGPIVDEIIEKLPDRAIIQPKPNPSFKPAARFEPVGALPKNGPQGWISNDDYPSVALRRDQEGTASYRLTIGSNGMVANCQITRSTGHEALDAATCKLISRRARFDPAKDSDGQKIAGSYDGQVSWRIPDF